MRVLVFSLINLFLAMNSAMAATSDHDGRYIYVRESYFQMNKTEQKSVIDYAVSLLQTEIRQQISKVPGLNTLSATFMNHKLMDTLTNDINRAVDLSDTLDRWWAPAGFMIYGGGQLGIGVGVHGQGSGDLGLVVVPEKVTVIDTVTGTKEERFHLDVSVVVVPHIYVGIGVGAGGSGSVGVSIIFGNLSRAQDFNGAVFAGSVEIAALVGVDFQPTVVHNLSTDRTFFVLTFETDFGAEATASADAELGAIIPLDAWLKKNGAGSLPTDINVTPTDLKK